ncbi:hypothetical protein D3C76_429870 [compost metagenome]
MIAIAARVLPTQADCDKLGQVLLWNVNLGYWASSRLERAIELLTKDPEITHWMRMPVKPACYK